MKEAPQGGKRGEDKADPLHHFGLEMVQKAGLELAVVRGTGQKLLGGHRRTAHPKCLILFDSTNMCVYLMPGLAPLAHFTLYLGDSFALWKKRVAHSEDAISDSPD